jgi:hypothetical protein
MKMLSRRLLNKFCAHYPATTGKTRQKQVQVSEEHNMCHMISRVEAVSCFCNLPGFDKHMQRDCGSKFYQQ